MSIDIFPLVCYNSYSEREVIQMTVVAGIIIFICGLGLIDYNQNHKAKHNLLIGSTAWLCVLTAIAIIGKGLNIF